MQLGDFPKNLYQERRQRLAQTIRQRSGSGILLIETAPEIPRNRDSEYPYRHDSDFYYLCGFSEPGAFLVMDIQQDQICTTLFCRPKDIDREIWDGIRLGPELAPEALGVDLAYSNSCIDEMLPTLLGQHSHLYAPITRRNSHQLHIDRWIEQIKSQSRSGLLAPQHLIDVDYLIHEMRLFKDADELDIMRRAAHISAKAHVRAMQACSPGLREYHLEAELLYEFRRHGSEHVAYNSIVAGGANACVLHHRAGNTELKNGDLCLIDAGCELQGYASDITRTFPVNGQFSPAQKAIYEVVLAAQEAAAAQTREGRLFTDPHDAAVKVITQGLIDLRLIQESSIDAAIEQKLYTPFYMHRTSHWLGMDVHDVGDYRERSTQCEPAPPRTLLPNMVLTLEPGIYIRPSEAIPEEYWHIGIRIEDDAIVQASGCELISRGAPVQADEIEYLMKHSQ